MPTSMTAEAALLIRTCRTTVSHELDLACDDFGDQADMDRTRSCWYGLEAEFDLEMDKLQASAVQHEDRADAIEWFANTLSDIYYQEAT